ncbi:MAG TPA: ATP-binding protein [Candidatus Nanopelagicaceae bacterium]|nr:ATP-binding protein [Candidatus Nanopelagicaceae bacterium]
MNIYLGPTVPGWEPRTEEDIQRALIEGFLEETHYLELKTQLDSGKKANHELARDLAQFAIDSGVIIFGIHENDDNTLSLTPVVLKGLAERIEEVGRALAEPPLQVTCTPIATVNDPSVGYLLVKIPSTGRAPHMVDGVYYGRGDKTKHRLSNAQVLRLHDQQRMRREDAEARLDLTISLDPIPEVDRKQAHVFLVATPNSHRSEMAIDFVRGFEAIEKVRSLVRKAMELSVAIAGPNSDGPLDLVSNVRSRHDGVACVSAEFGDGRTIDVQKRGFEYATELEVSDSGELRIFSALFSRASGNQDLNTPSEYQILDIFAPMLTRQILIMAEELSHQTGFTGDWSLGFAATGIAGLAAEPSYSHYSETRYDVQKDFYKMTTVASLEEIEQIPGRITRTLVGRLMRALDREAKYEGTYFQDPATPNDSTGM